MRVRNTSDSSYSFRRQRKPVARARRHIRRRPVMTSQPYSMLVRCKQWADRGLYETIDRDAGRLGAEDAAILPLILDHMQVVDRIFQHHLQGLPHGYRAPRSDETPGIEQL